MNRGVDSKDWLAPEVELPGDWFDANGSDWNDEDGAAPMFGIGDGHRHHIPDIHDELPPEGFDLDEGLGDA